MIEKFKNKVFQLQSERDFEECAIDIFRWQSTSNKVYQEYIKHLQVDVNLVQSIHQIPFLPIQTFKTHAIRSVEAPVQRIFTSSGTSGNISSQHHVSDLSIYERSFISGFEHTYGALSEYRILALLPSYLERQGSSLIYMAEQMISLSTHQESGFYLYNMDELFAQLKQLKSQNKKTILIGVSFALTDFVAKYSIDWPDLIVMETGGMKGRKKELTRDELHTILSEGFGVSHVHSEYGMTELLSQAYARQNGHFHCPPWMSVHLRDPSDPLSQVKMGKTGGINVIDLANLESCCFIATDDLGKKHSNQSFEVLGRFDHSDVRGCNLMI